MFHGYIINLALFYVNITEFVVCTHCLKMSYSADECLNKAYYCYFACLFTIDGC